MKNKDMFEDKKNRNLFKETYWGNFPFTEDQQSVLDNRLQFTKDYNLKGLDHSQKTLDYMKAIITLPFIDHVEVYKTTEGELLVVVSPYHHGKPEELIESIKDYDPRFYVYPNLYRTSALTFLKLGVL